MIRGAADIVDDPEERPLVTFALFAYNQERFIREAVEGALAQDYSPLEIILSDDCSPDRTFEIMQEMVAGYDGPHRIVLNRNPVNLGVGAHVNRVVELAKGDLIVGAAGDDVSLPIRVTETVRAWEQSGREATSIYSAVELIDEFGNSRGNRDMYRADLSSLNELSCNLASPHGASHAFCHALMDKFGPMSSDVVNEDQVIGFRSALIGSIAYLDRPLVRYRVHDSSLCSRLHAPAPISTEQTRINAHIDAERVSAFRRQNVCDALTVLEPDHPVIAVLERQVWQYEFVAAIYGRKLTIWRSLSSAWNLIQRGVSPSIVVKVLLKAAIWPVYARYHDWRRRWVIRRHQERASHVA